MKAFKVLTILVAVTALFSLGACNTFSGMGEDLQKGGRAIQNAAE